ncbi:helix-turn-helix domain-containing protein [Teredinibacter sp. KSP-S5-2]|uniref:helix-turn-helix domain-containing protein n=1 Tax=Teredinibacter sp. KSP-S5-2 TaxID=3034506 RepID=UPI0029343E80|nr:helix-turn-helix domain-containing protein [Teredinibacter sp. KSP-S5-2]WNO11579.1 helix-turn-helix domain-containing protein [Teredinibacter sp. KSP-S5-2]
MSYVITLSLIALSLKLLTLLIYKKEFLTLNKYLLSIILGITGMNSIEMFFYSYINQPENGLVVLIFFYLFVLVFVYSSLLYALNISNHENTTSVFFSVFGFITCCVVLLTPGAAISGIESIGYSITRIPGPYYHILQIGILIPLLSCIVIAFLTLVTSRKHQLHTQALAYLITFTPTFFIGSAIIFLMHIGVKVNASVVISFSTSFLLWLLLFTQKKESMYRLMSLIPGTRANKLYRQLAYHICNPQNGMNDPIHYLEIEIIHEALQMTNGNRAEAAELLGISKPTLQRRLKDQLEKEPEKELTIKY